MTVAPEGKGWYCVECEKVLHVGPGPTPHSMIAYCTNPKCQKFWSAVSVVGIKP